MLVFAHRGDSAHYPENTLPAIKSAVDIGADGIEIDVYASKDDQLVVIHDARLERTTDAKGRVEEHTLDTLHLCNIENGNSIPTLAEVLRTIPESTWLNIELKGHNTAPLLLDLLSDDEFSSWLSRPNLLISSFNHHALATLYKQQPSLKLGALTASIPLEYAHFAQMLNAYSIHVDQQFINYAFVNDAHRRGLKVFVYTVDHPVELERLFMLGVDAIFANDPANAKHFVRQFTRSH